MKCEACGHVNETRKKSVLPDSGFHRIELTRGLFAMVDDMDLPAVKDWNWYAHQI